MHSTVRVYESAHAIRSKKKAHDALDETIFSSVAHTDELGALLHTELPRALPRRRELRHEIARAVQNAPRVLIGTRAAERCIRHVSEAVRKGMAGAHM